MIPFFLLDDAEEKQLIKPDVKNWLGEVKDETEDVLDEIGYEAQRSKFEGYSQTSMDHVWNFLSSKLNLLSKKEKETAEKLKKIFEKLERAVRHKGDLRPIEGIAGGKPLTEKKGPLPDEFHVYGRDADKEAVMELLKLDRENGPKVVAIPIVGLGGVGKTTLAQIVYNDRRVEQMFQLKAWVWVAEQFDVSRVIEDMLKEVNAKIFANKEADELLKEALKGKKVFLVLDNVCSIEYNEWPKLLLSLQDVEKGSKIIVTTHSEHVAKAIETVIPPHPVDGITDEECWLLFANHAFGGINSTAESHLEELGREIVSKCKGLPLAARTLGGVFHSKTDYKEWEMIAKSSMWSLSNENIPLALKLSYYHLSSDEKRCFSYCAIIPKGSTFRKDQLIMLWMAEGFLGNEDMEDRGNEYFDDLVWRSLFQQSRDDPSSFIMHDLINDLAQYVSGEFCFKVGEFGSSKAPKKTRHFSHQLKDYNHVLKNFEDIHEVPPLRTFASMSDESKFHIDLDEKVLHDLLPMLNRLRVLSLSRQYWELYTLEKIVWITPLLDSIGNLKHLRYLDLSAMNMTRLPEKVSALYSLQTIILRGCRHLMVLPTNMSNLINLQHLIIEGTCLREMPSQMRKLIMLQKLTDFFLGKQSGSNLKELGKLVNLRGTLSIWDLQNTLSVQDALEADLKSKKHLEKLRFSWDGRTGDSQRERVILEKLEPHSNVKSLVICGYGGRLFPDWVGDSAFSNLATLTLNQCKNCTSLPPLGQLSSLKQLCVMSLDRIVAVGSEFYGRCPSMKKPFASLQKLEFLFMPRWREWIP